MRGILFFSNFPFRGLSVAPHSSKILFSLFPLAALSCVAVAVHGCAALDTSASTPGVLPPWEASVASGDAAAATPFDAASACRPGALQAYHTNEYRSASPPQDVCRASAGGDPVQLFYDSCFGPNATYGDCNSFKTDKATAACAACILTPETAPQYGALISHGGFISANVAGCVELTEPAELACAKSIQALADCELAACEANCPVGNSTAFAAYSACASDADQTGCLAYATAASCPIGAGADGTAGPCVAQSFADFYGAAARLFCAASAPPSSDADASTAAQQDASDSGRPD